MKTLVYEHHLPDLAAFIAVLVGILIMILVGHASAEMLTAASASASGVYSLWARRPAPIRTQS